MSDVNKAHEVMEKSDHIGKIVLSIKGEKNESARIPSENIIKK